MKACVIGTGFGSRVVARAYQESGIDVEIVSPRDQEAVERACAGDSDFISIHSPPFMHLGHVLLAARHRKHIVCDKPFGRSADEARQMLAAAEEAGVIHLLNFEFRHEPVRVKAKELLDAGAIGRPAHIAFSAMMSGSRVPLKPHGWLWERDLGGGWIGAFGSHAIDALRWWFGEIQSVNGICRTEIALRPDADGRLRRSTAEDGFSAAFLFENGATACLDTSFAAPVNGPYRIEIFGDEGLLSMNFGTELQLIRTDGTNEHFAFGPYEGDIHMPAFLRWASTLRAAIADRQQIEPSFRAGVAAAEVMDMLRRNATWVSAGDGDEADARAA